MAWSTPYVVYRYTENGTFVVVYTPEDLKKAKYVMTYIALPGDLCCRTPIHPKYTGKDGTPEYFSHKAKSGSAITDPADWERYVKEKKINSEFYTSLPQP